jgi:PrtD family type I secretion system ABC transporter
VRPIPFSSSPFYAALKTAKSAIISAAVFSGFCNVLMLTGSIYMLQVYDRVLTSRSIPTLIGLSTICVLLFIFLGLYEALRTRIMGRIGEKIEEQIAPKVFDLVTTMPLYTSSRADGMQPLRDMDSIRGFVGGAALLTLFDMPWVPFYLIICYMFHFWVGTATVIGVLVLVTVTIFNEFYTKANIRKVTESQSERLGQLDHARRNAEVLKAMGMTPALREKWLEANNVGMMAQRNALDTAAGFTSTSKILRMVLQSFVLAVGAILVIRGDATGGVMIACSVLSARALAPIDQAIGHWKQFSQARDSHTRLTQLLLAMPDRKAKVALPAPRETLELMGIAIIPPGTKQVAVSEASFKLPKGSGLAIIGPSASGKSSLAKAIVGIWEPVRGEIRFDGSTMNQWHPDEIGKSIGYLPQDVSLFAGTIAQNIARFETKPNNAKIIEAATTARVHKLITDFPEGYSTVLGENGAGLSQGQRQRIALARAIYNNPFVVVLDEPNANLDKEGEQALADAILDIRKQGAIVIVIDHRHSAIQSLNYIAEMEGGRIKRIISAEQMNAKSQTPPTVQAPKIAAKPEPMVTIPREPVLIEQAAPVLAPKPAPVAVIQPALVQKQAPMHAPAPIFVRQAAPVEAAQNVNSPPEKNPMSLASLFPTNTPVTQ